MVVMEMGGHGGLHGRDGDRAAATLPNGFQSILEKRQCPSHGPGGFVYTPFFSLLSGSRQSHDFFYGALLNAASSTQVSLLL